VVVVGVIVDVVMGVILDDGGVAQGRGMLGVVSGSAGSLLVGTSGGSTTSRERDSLFTWVRETSLRFLGGKTFLGPSLCSIFSSPSLCFSSAREDA
jgi:hypothetical protein